MRTRLHQRWCLAWVLTVLLSAALPYPSAAQNVTYDDLLHAENKPGNWVMYGGQYSSQRFSRLAQINAGNAGQLRLQWVRQLGTLASVESSPLVVDGILYVTIPENVVLALDARTGVPFWTYYYHLPRELLLCCGKQNRGVAILGDRLFMGTLDAHLISLDAKTGALLWDTKVADGLAGYSITAAPLVVKDMVLTGVAGGEYGIRGFVDAYDAATGERRWRTYTVPEPGEPGSETWDGDTWRTGGAPTWVTGSFDPRANLVYWGTGNPGPDWNGDMRPGDNLYSDSVLALDADTGKLEWHFQFTPHDVHDWDACQTPVLLDREIGGETLPLMVWANRNGFFYQLDRRTGRFRLAEPFAEQNWAQSITEEGRPVRLPNRLPSKEGTLVFPSVDGAANWWSPSYSPDTGLLYVMAFDGADTFYIADAEHREGELFVGGYPQSHVPVDTYTSAVRAIDVRTGERRWQFPVQAKSRAGLTATAGNLVFGGTVGGNFFALDATTGKELWHVQLGGVVQAAPVTYLVDGRQYVSVAAGGSLFTFSLPSGD